MKKKYWKSPEEKQWFSFYVDGKYVGVFEDSGATKNEITRLRGLKGIEVKEALPEHLISAKAATSMPSRIIKKMQEVFTVSCK